MVRNAPLTRVHTSEALRMALGLTLADHKVSLLYLEDGAYAALDLKPEAIDQPGIGQSIEMFPGMKVRELVEKEAIDAQSLPRLRKGVEPIGREKALSLIGEADVVISY